MLPNLEVPVFQIADFMRVLCNFLSTNVKKFDLGQVRWKVQTLAHSGWPVIDHQAEKNTGLSRKSGVERLFYYTTRHTLSNIKARHGRGVSSSMSAGIRFWGRLFFIASILLMAGCRGVV